MMLRCRYTLPEYYTLLYGNIIDYTYIHDEWKHKYYSAPCVRMLYVYILEYLRPDRNCDYILITKFRALIIIYS